MTNQDTDFETWYSVLQINVLDNTGIEYEDEVAARADYASGRDVYDVIDEITIDYI